MHKDIITITFSRVKITNCLIKNLNEIHLTIKKIYNIITLIKAL